MRTLALLVGAFMVFMAGFAFGRGEAREGCREPKTLTAQVLDVSVEALDRTERLLDVCMARSEDTRATLRKTRRALDACLGEVREAGAALVRSQRADRCLMGSL